eukprot:1409020-Rhodomonas_salina.2
MKRPAHQQGRRISRPGVVDEFETHRALLQPQHPGAVLLPPHLPRRIQPPASADRAQPRALQPLRAPVALVVVAGQ